VAEYLRFDRWNEGSGAGLVLCDQGFPTPSKIGSGARESTRSEFRSNVEASAAAASDIQTAFVEFVKYV